MIIRIFGIRRSFGYWQIGGTDSFYRRIGEELVRLGHGVEFIHYACQEEKSQKTPSGITVTTFRDFMDALNYLATQQGPILVNAIAARDRLNFIRFRKKMSKKIDFYIVYSYFAPSFYGRFKHFLEAFLLPYNGGAVCMSQRLASCAAGYRNKPTFVMPPIPDEYYCPIALKMKHSKDHLVVSYVGRLEEGKGIEEAIQILERLSREERFECRTYGYAFDGDPLTDEYHERILKNDRILYQRQTHESWSPDHENRLGAVLRETDVLLLPYQTVSSSIDTPLLLLEGMASLCCCVTRPLAEIPELYDQSPFLIDGKNVDDFTAKACSLIEKAGNGTIENERRRLEKQRSKLGFDIPGVTQKLLGILGENQ